MAGFITMQLGFRCTSLLGALMATGGLIISAFAQSIVVIFISMGLITGKQLKHIKVMLQSGQLFTRMEP